MKMIVAIIHDDDANITMDKLRERGHFVTKLSTSGGFLRAGNTTLITGVEADMVDDVFKVFEVCCKSRKELTALSTPYGSGQGFIPRPIEVVMGGATVFVLEVDQFCKF